MSKMSRLITAYALTMLAPIVLHDPCSKQRLDYQQERSAYNAPSKKIPLSPTFRLNESCRVQMIKSGRIRIQTSSRTLRTDMEMSQLLV